MSNKIAVIILAGGDGLRMGFSLPKQFHKLKDGRRIIDLTLRSYFNIEQVDKIIFSYNQDYELLSKAVCKQFLEKIHFVKGGKTRQQSMYLALKEIKTEYVLIQDSARPLVWDEAVLECAKKLQEGSEAVYTIFSTCTDMCLIEDRQILNVFNRGEIGYPQCPCGFLTKELKEYFEYAIQKGEEFFSEISLALYANPKLKIDLIEGHQSGFKVTYPEDILLLEAYIGLNNK